MDKIKSIFFLLAIPSLILIAVLLIKIKDKEDFKQKIVLAQEIRKVLDHMMVDLREAQENTILDVPPDGQWHHRFSFVQDRQGALEYVLKEGHLFRINQGKRSLIADDIRDLRIRRQKDTPDILEVQIEAENNTTLVSNLKIRVRQ